MKKFICVFVAAAALSGCGPSVPDVASCVDRKSTRAYDLAWQKALFEATNNTVKGSVALDIAFEKDTNTGPLRAGDWQVWCTYLADLRSEHGF